MSHFKPLDAQELTVIDRARAALSTVPGIQCTACRYCTKDCPQGIPIPGIFNAMNKYLIYDGLTSAKGSYMWETREGGVASKCIACGQCEAVCPQHIAIIETLKQAVETLEAR